MELLAGRPRCVSLGLVRRALGEDLVRLHRARGRLVDGPHLGPDSPQAVSGSPGRKPRSLVLAAGKDEKRPGSACLNPTPSLTLTLTYPSTQPN